MLRLLACTLIVAALPAVCWAQPQASPKGATDVVALLEKSGHRYTKVSDGVWEIIFSGDNVKDFPVRLALGEGMLIGLSKVANRKDLKLEPALLTKVLEMNHSMDSVKLALSDDMLYVRLDTHLRILDGQELKYILDQLSGVTDEVYPQIKPFLNAPAK